MAEVWGQCVDATNPDCIHKQLTLYEPPGTASRGVNMEKVQLFSGEFYKSAVDLRIRGRGIDFVWARTYRSRTGKNTSIGNNWSHSYDKHIEACSGNLILHDGSTGRQDTYYAQPNGIWAADGFFREFRQELDGSFRLTFPDTGSWTFRALDESNAPGKISAMTDRNGNSLRFEYDDLGRLTKIHDTLDTTEHNRDITIDYNEENFIETVTDFAGRTISYECENTRGYWHAEWQ
jgi:YD repeat-containing protein